MKKSVLALAVMATTCLPLNVFAQENAYVEKLEKRLMALEQKIYNGPAAAPAVAQGSNAQNQAMLADFEARLQNLEEESSKVYGAVEELGNTVHKFAEKMEMISKDFDLRIQDLENNPAASAPSTAASSETHGMPVSPDKAALAKNSGKFTDRISARGKETTEAAHTPAASKVHEEKKVEEVALEGFSDSMTDQEYYDAAYKLIVATKYSQAEKAMNTFIEKRPESKLLDNAYYWLGEVYLVQSMPEKAVITFSKGLAKFPKGQKAAGNLLKMGVAFKQMGKADFAKSSWTKLMNDYPQSAEAEKAKKELGKL